MASTPQQRLREIRDEASALAAKGIEFTSDDSQTFEALMAEGDALKSQVGQLDRFNDLKGWMDTSAGALPLAGSTPAGTPAGETVFSSSAQGDKVAVKMAEQYGEGILSDEKIMATTTPAYKAVFRDYLKYGEKGLNNFSGAAIKTLQEGQDTEGGFIIPADILSMLIAKSPTPTRIAARTTQLNTSRDTLVAPRVNYSSATDDSNGFIYSTGIRSVFTGEIPASSTTMRVTDPVFGQMRVPVFTNMLSLPLTADLVDDASFDVTAWVSNKFGETIELLRDKTVLAGTGIGQPAGILNAPGADASQPASVNIGNPLTADGIISLGFALPEQYDTNACFVFSKTQTGPVIAKLKDSDGRYLWGAGLQDSGLMPGIRNRQLLGYDCIMSEFMPSPGANAYPLLFGDLAGYFLVNRVGISVRVLNELYAETNQSLVLGRVRFGGAVAEPWRLYCGKQA